MFVFAKTSLFLHIWIAAMRNLCGDLLNPVLVVHLLPYAITTFSRETPPTAASYNRVNANSDNIIGSRYHDYGESILERMWKVSNSLTE